jgi:hypothetical protein
MAGLYEPRDGTQHTVGILGVRDFREQAYTNVNYVIRTFEHHLFKNEIPLQNLSVVTGGGSGVEAMLVEWCNAKRVPCRKIPPNIADHGARRAFIIRNNRVVSDSDELVMFWDGSITLLGDSIMTAMHMSKLATIYPVI